MARPIDGREDKRRRRALMTRVLSEECSCWLCGHRVDANLRGRRVVTPRGTRPLHPWAPVLDEVRPVSLGGDALDRDNVKLAHSWCNNYRKARTDIDNVRRELREMVTRELVGTLRTPWCARRRSYEHPCETDVAPCVPSQDW